MFHVFIKLKYEKINKNFKNLGILFTLVDTFDNIADQIRIVAQILSMLVDPNKKKKKNKKVIQV